MKKIIHISPALPPSINGLGDFCDILACNLEKAGYTDHIFVLRQQVSAIRHRSIYLFNPKTFFRVLSELKADVVILHYVGYAYDRNALPFYIESGLRRFKSKVGCRLLVFFHELYSCSKSPFKLPFYTTRLQKIIVRRLWYLADKAFTSCNWYKDLLQEVIGIESRKTLCTGIFSNVPDDLYDEKMPREENSMLVFGSTQRRNAVYGHPQFSELVERLGIKRVYDVGPGECHCDSTNVKIEAKGPLPPKEVAFCLNSVKFGALSYKPHLLGKSGIFSAYAAFGVVPLNLASGDHPLSDGLVEGKNYFSAIAKLTESEFSYDAAREEILKWYRMHDQRSVTERLSAWL